MRDNLRQYRALRKAVTQGYRVEPHGQYARHVGPLAALLSGIVASQSPQRPQGAANVPEDTKRESRVTRCARWVGNDTRWAAADCVPSAARWLRQVAWQTLGLVRDGSGVGRGGIALRIPGVAPGRALPLAWRVRQGPKGPLPADLHRARVEVVRGLSPAGVPVG